MSIWLMILGMAAITFSVRYLFLARSIPIRVNVTLQRVLRYSAPAVLTALWIPIVFFPKHELDISLNNPFLLAALITIALALSKLHTLLVVVLAMCSFVGLNYLLR